MTAWQKREQRVNEQVLRKLGVPTTPNAGKKRKKKRHSRKDDLRHWKSHLEEFVQGVPSSAENRAWREHQQDMRAFGDVAL